MSDHLYKRCDCGRRQWAKCRHGWWLHYQFRKTHHRRPLDRYAGKHLASKSEAQAVAAEMIAKIHAGTLAAVPFTQTGATTLGGMLDAYFRDLKRVGNRRATALTQRQLAIDLIKRTSVPTRSGASRA